MRHTPNVKAERYRVIVNFFPVEIQTGNNGAFQIPLLREDLNVIVSDGGGWDHVSVSLPGRLPTWVEMCAVKDLFFGDDETVVQFHPAKQHYVNDHPNCLHLWRDQSGGHKLPPEWMVGRRPGETVDDLNRQAEAAGL